MKCLRPVLILVCLLAACGACAWAAQIDWEIANLEKVAQPPQSVALEYKFPEGESRRYDVTVAGVGVLKLPGQTSETRLQTNSDLTFVEQVMPKPLQDGIWRISRKLVKGEMTLPDFGKLPVSAPALEIEMDKYGAVRTIKGLDQLSSTFGLPSDKAMADILTQTKSVGFPKKDLKVNDTWTDQYAVQLANQKSVAITATSVLAGFDRILKTDCATIVTKYEAPFSFALDATDEKPAGDQKDASAPDAKPKVFAGTEKGEFRTYFSYSDGKIMQSYGTIELTADLDTGTKTETKAADDKPAAPAAPAAASDAKPASAPATSTEIAKHDLSVTYYITSLYNPEPAKDAKPAEKVSAK